ncbi:hypothetical protein [Longimicrobium terrae]|uniref:Uncharacterized protein n=1 Tax=Longimicrobium terrae TaxID=1639882 RepID=A0A841GU56_9BACT|nr:hypothetical protein [Longimicrobium terrae]MBB4634282.1 hypothetical protein [Longimicrobium terrae]MBB6068828.1 hypothetical protein [Longimicrobium terrae]NNC28010.1 hypothetical protein [Longimicrobium terrae]
MAEYNLTGYWAGSLPPDGHVIRLNLIDQSGSIRGAGAIFIGERIFTGDVLGNVHLSGEFLLNLYQFPPDRFLFRGKMTSDSTMTGILTESGYAGEEMTLSRWQPTPATGAAAVPR